MKIDGIIYQRYFQQEHQIIAESVLTILFQPQLNEICSDLISDQRQRLNILQCGAFDVLERHDGSKEVLEMENSPIALFYPDVNTLTNNFCYIYKVILQAKQMPSSKTLCNKVFGSVTLIQNELDVLVKYPAIYINVNWKDYLSRVSHSWPGLESSYLLWNSECTDWYHKSLSIAVRNPMEFNQCKVSAKVSMLRKPIEAYGFKKTLCISDTCVYYIGDKKNKYQRFSWLEAKRRCEAIGYILPTFRNEVQWRLYKALYNRIFHEKIKLNTIWKGKSISSFRKPHLSFINTAEHSPVNMCVCVCDVFTFQLTCRLIL